jgi:hypothetical protein
MIPSTRREIVYEAKEQMRHGVFVLVANHGVSKASAPKVESRRRILDHAVQHPRYLRLDGNPGLVISAGRGRKLVCSIAGSAKRRGPGLAVLLRQRQGETAFREPHALQCDATTHLEQCVGKLAFQEIMDANQKAWCPCPTTDHSLATQVGSSALEAKNGEGLPTGSAGRGISKAHPRSTR